MPDLSQYDNKTAGTELKQMYSLVIALLSTVASYIVSIFSGLSCCNYSVSGTLKILKEKIDHFYNDQIQHNGYNNNVEELVVLSLPHIFPF